MIKRGNNRLPIFAESADGLRFLAITRQVTSEERVNVHAFVVMTTHFHMIATPSHKDALPRAMKRIGIRYTQYYNRQHGRIGTPWNGRYKGLLIENEAYWLTCLRYVEQNPVRAHMVSDPADYQWSSYRVHALGEESDWLVPHSLYTSLGVTPATRQAAYRAICAISLDQTELTLQRRPPKRTPETAAKF